MRCECFRNKCEVVEFFFFIIIIVVIIIILRETERAGWEGSEREESGRENSQAGSKLSAQSLV